MGLSFDVCLPETRLWSFEDRRVGVIQPLIESLFKPKKG